MTCTCQQQDFCVQSGETWHPTIRWGTGVLTTKAITAINRAAPAAITAPAHGVPNGWPVAIRGVEGMTQINAKRYPPQGDDWHAATVSDANSLSLNDVDSSAYTAYDEDGFVVYDTPKDFTGCSFALTIYDNPEHDGTALAALTSPTDITLESTLKTITPLLQTAALTWDIGYFRLLATEPSGVVTELLRGSITIE